MTLSYNDRSNRNVGKYTKIDKDWFLLSLMKENIEMKDDSKTGNAYTHI